MGNSKPFNNYFGEWYRTHESFIVRNPLFPIEAFFNWKSESNIVEIKKDELEKSLSEFYLQPIVQEALFIGSPELHEQCLLWLENKIEKQDKKEKIVLSLVKYMIRMCTRCTPYGLFASCSIGKISGHTSIQLEDKKSLHRYGRLDMDYVGELLSFLLSQKEILEQLQFYPNSSLYPLGNQLRYIEHRFQKETGRSYHLVQIEQSTFIEKILLIAKNGSTIDELAAAITDAEISAEEAIEFITELIREQVLVSELEPNVTGEEYFSSLLRKLKTLRHAEKIVEQLENVVKEIEQIKLTNGEAKNNFYKNIVSHLQKLDVTLHLKTLIQVDSFRPSISCTLSKKIIDEMLNGASLLQLLTTNDSISDNFSDFKNAFIQRYESQWVPLVEVLDTESGIGYGKFATTGMEESPLIDKLPINDATFAADDRRIADAETFKWQLYHEAVTLNKTQVNIDDKVIELLSKKEFSAEALPDSIYMMVKINAPSSNEIDNGNYKVTLQPPTGPSGGNLLGRFCHLNSEIENFTKAILKDEEAHHSDCIFAEIVHLPESRIGNILMRPILRQYEIPYLCGSTLSSEFQIPVTDLLVGIEDNKVILHSQRLNRRVIPRMTTAHNFSMTTLPVYQFLCNLQYQQIRSIGWQWGVLDNRPFLPRVSYGKLILSKARWLLTKDDIEGFAKKNEDEFLPAFSEMVKNKNLPQYILLSQGDNELLLDVENIFCIRLLLGEINKSETVMLTETLDLPGQCWIESDEGHHAGEFIFAFNKNETATVPLKKNLFLQQEEKKIERYFPVGSEWLYAKIYCGTKTAEKILSEALKPFADELISEKIIDKFFFLRYNDAAHHIRIRFHHKDEKDFWKEVMERLQEVMEPFMKNHLVHNLQFETYQREVERYGFDTIEQSEDIFYYQSVAVLNFIPMLYGDEGERYRWQVAIKAIDFFLDDFHYTTEQKRNLVKLLYENFSNEFKIGAPQQKKISERFSSNKQLIQKLMDEVTDENENLKQAIGIFRIEDENYHNAINEILQAPSIHHDAGQINHLMQSYLHMFVNRICVSNQRKIELVIYDHLLKFYESKIAREKNKKIRSDTEVKADIG